MYTNIKMSLKGILEKPFLLFSPFLLLSLVIIFIFDDPCLVGDENKYIEFAGNLLNGYYSLPAPNIYLGVGPGYPILLIPIIALKLPLISIVFLNGFFYYFSIIIIYKTLIQITNLKVSLIGSFFWACYYNLYENFALILPEVFSSFLISIMLFFLVRAFRSNAKIFNNYLLYAGLTIGFLALTKIIFGYVLLAMLIGNGILLLINLQSVNYRRGLIILLVGLIATLPYLIYTYHLTGKVLYWGSTGGNNMYWMSTPHIEEYGSWFPDPIHSSDSVKTLMSESEFRLWEHLEIREKKLNIPGTDDYISHNHDKLIHLSGIDQDDALKKLAIQNILNNPLKYIKNCFSNLGRILFNYPYSYKYQKPGTLLRFPMNGIIVVLALFCLLPTIMNWKKIPFAIRFSLMVFCIYMGGSIVGSAESRMFNVTLPILLIWILYIIMKTFRLKLNKRTF